MKKFFKFVPVFVLGLALAAGLVSCGNDDSNTPVPENKDKQLQAVTDQYVQHVVYKTYSDLATASDDLYAQVAALRDKQKAGSLTQADINQAGKTFLKARKLWEMSEAWVGYGPAAEFHIDPHIDTWPLSQSGLAQFFKDHYEALFVTNTDVNKQIQEVSHLNGEDSWLGFHGLEYILFRDGQVRPLAAFAGTETDPQFAQTNPNVTGAMELNFAVAVAGDLRDHCSYLECAWMGDAAPKAHRDNCTRRGFTLLLDGQYSGPAMMGLKTESYKTWRGVIGVIISSGCSDICQEVSDQKMGQVYRTATNAGTQEDSRDYIESPYSHNSFTDFLDNTLSVKNALYGNIEQDHYEANSIMGYLVRNNKPLADDLQSKLTDALNKLNACRQGAPLVTIANTADAQGLQKMKAAMDAMDALGESLNAAVEWIQKN